MITEKQVDRKMRDLFNLSSNIRDPEIIKNGFDAIFKELLYQPSIETLGGSIFPNEVKITGYLKEDKEDFLLFCFNLNQKNKQNILINGFEHFLPNSHHFRYRLEPRYRRKKYRFTYFIRDYYNINNESIYQLIEKGQMQLL